MSVKNHLHSSSDVQEVVSSTVPIIFSFAANFQINFCEFLAMAEATCQMAAVAVFFSTLGLCSNNF
jgi:hypothetical protein